MFDLAGSSCHDPRDIGIHLWLGRLRARAHGAINHHRPDPCLYRSGQRLCCGDLALGYATLAPGRVTFHRVLGAIALYLNIGLMFGAIYRMIWYFIPSSLTNIPGDAGCGLWPDTLFQLCHPYIDRLWRHRAGPSRYPHARQCRGHHRPIVSANFARSPDHAGASRGAAALLTKTPARPRDFERWIDGRRPRSGWKSREQGA